MDILDRLAAVVLEHLAWTSLQAVLLIVVVAALIRALPRLPAAARCALWWLVGAQALLGLAWQAPIRLPLLAPAITHITAPQHGTPAHAAALVSDVVPVRGTAVAAHAVASPAATSASTATVSVPSWLATHWRTLFVALWLLALLAQAPALIRQHRLARRLRRAARMVPQAGLQRLCARQARVCGLRRAPAVLASPGIDSPQVSGTWRPVVLWPKHAALGVRESALALAHELAHIRRGDLLLGWVPALAMRLFFFHPLLRWAMHEYALHREAACDALALAQQHVAPQDYGALLLRLGVAHPLHAGLASASPTFHNLKRRLAMLQETPRAVSRAHGWMLVAAVAAAGVLPYRVVANEHVRPAASSAAPATASTTWTPPAPPLPAPPMPPPVPPPPPADFGFRTGRVDIDISPQSTSGFALFDGRVLVVNGTSADAAAIKRLPKTGKPLLWFRRGDQAWVVHDPGCIERAQAIYAEVSALADAQGELGERQGAIGEQRGKLGEQQGQLGALQGQLAGQQGELARQQADLANRAVALDSRSTGDDAAERRALQAEAAKLDAQRRALDQRQAALSKQQGELSQHQRALSLKQQGFGKQQQALGDKQHVAAKQVAHKLDALLDDALAKGIATPVARS